MNTLHPNAIRLDAVAAGDADAEVDAHLETCAECKDYVTTLAAEARAASTDAGAFMAKLAARDAKVEEPEAAAPQSPAAGAKVYRLAWIAAPLAIAAVLFLILRPAGTRELDPLGSSGDPATRFKGGIQVAIVLDRDGDQRRLVSDVRVRPGDRIRAEVAVDSTQPLLAGMLGNDGTWVVLLAPTTLEAGTHFSERAARFDDAPTEGFVLVGHPDAVERARKTRRFDDVRAIPVVRDR